MRQTVYFLDLEIRNFFQLKLDHFKDLGVQGVLFNKVEDGLFSHRLIRIYNLSRNSIN